MYTYEVHLEKPGVIHKVFPFILKGNNVGQWYPNVQVLTKQSIDCTLALYGVNTTMPVASDG